MTKTQRASSLPTTLFLALVLAGSVPAQEAGDGQPRASLSDLAAATKVGITQAIDTAVTARPGVACSAELEGAVGSSVFEVLILAEDGKVYEVRVGGNDGKVQSNEVCDDEEDVEEITALKGKIGKGVSLGGLVETTQKLLVGKCAHVEFDAEHKLAKVLMVNGQFQLEAAFSLKRGALKEIEIVGGGDDPKDEKSEKSSKKEKGEENEQDEKEEAEEHGKEHERPKGKKKQG